MISAIRQEQCVLATSASQGVAIYRENSWIMRWVRSTRQIRLFGFSLQNTGPVALIHAYPTQHQSLPSIWHAQIFNILIRKRQQIFLVYLRIESFRQIECFYFTPI